MKNYIGLVLLFCLVGCFKQPAPKFRMPAPGEKLDNLESIINSLGSAVSTPVDSTTQCSEELEKFYTALFSLTSTDVDLQ